MSWISAYGYLLVKAVIGLIVGILLFRFTTGKSKLIYYVSHTPWIQVNLPNQPQATYLGAGTLFLWNGGKAPALQVEVGHYLPLPPYGILPAVQYNVIPLSNGGTLIEFPHVPPKTLITISYLFQLPATSVEHLISYVRSREGPAQRIPVALLRVFPKPILFLLFSFTLIGLWVATNELWNLVEHLWKTYHHY